jgi:hypothetical protein
VTKRVARLHAAARAVGEGDLSVRVAPKGKDELDELGRAFDRMVAELAQAHSRVEYLQKVSAWQEVARRLAHEIKNPLMPIQLAVQEIASKYSGDDPAYRRSRGRAAAGIRSIRHLPTGRHRPGPGHRTQDRDRPRRRCVRRRGASAFGRRAFCGRAALLMKRMAYPAGGRESKKWMRSLTANFSFFSRAHSACSLAVSDKWRSSAASLASRSLC